MAQVKLTRKQNLIQTLKFVLFSASAGIIQTVTFTLMNELGDLPYWPSYLTALVLSVLWNFTLNRRFTFKSAKNVPIAMLMVAGYYAVFTPASTLWGQALTDIGWNEYLVLFFTMLINLTTEYLFTRFVVYRNSINTNAYARKEKEMKALERYFFGKAGYITKDLNREKFLDSLTPYAKPGGIVFAGDSITEGFAVGEYFAGYPVYNRGIGGDTSAELLARTKAHINALSPSKVFILIGTNDLAHGFPVAEIAQNIQKIVTTIKEDAPGAKIHIISVLPVSNKIILKRNPKILALNELLKGIPDVKYIDVNPEFAGANGDLKPQYTYDGLHLTQQGYARFRELLMPYIEE